MVIKTLFLSLDIGEPFLGYLRDPCTDGYWGSKSEKLVAPGTAAGHKAELFFSQTGYF